MRYSQQRETFGKPLAGHQLIQAKLAEMGTRIHAAKLMTYHAANLKAQGKRCDLEAGMAKFFASETAEFCASEGHSGARRHGLHPGVARGALFQGLETPRGGRGLERDSAPHHRQEASGAIPRIEGRMTRRIQMSEFQMGRWYEDFVVGEVIKHRPGRTILESDNTWFTPADEQHPLRFISTPTTRPRPSSGNRSSIPP